MNVVLVEDNDDLRYLLHRDIVKAGYEVALASCAEDLDDLAAKVAFQLMVLDVNLPGENGYSIARRFRQSNPNMYIVMLTARDEVSDKISGYEEL
jgi:DNA-binding response OmpR family regulator